MLSCGLNHGQTSCELRRDLVAKKLRQPRQGLHGDHVAVGDGRRDGDGVDAGTGAVVDHGLGAGQLEQFDHRGLR